MAVLCPECRSDLTQTLTDRDQCLACGHLWFPNGQEAPAGFVWTTDVVDHQHTAGAPVHPNVEALSGEEDHEEGRKKRRRREAA